MAGLPLEAQENLLARLSAGYASLSSQEKVLERDLEGACHIEDDLQAACYYRDTVLPDMAAVRSLADALERDLPDSALPYPNYEQLLFSV